jgi:hypothetical protein
MLSHQFPASWPSSWEAAEARRTHHEASDVDLGLYYRAEGLDLDALARASRAFGDTGQVEDRRARRLKALGERRWLANRQRHPRRLDPARPRPRARTGRPRPPR